MGIGYTATGTSTTNRLGLHFIGDGRGKNTKDERTAKSKEQSKWESKGLNLKTRCRTCYLL